MVERCTECGSEDLLPSEKRITLAPDGQLFERPVPAVRCAACGRMYPAGSDAPTARRIHVDQTWPPE